MQLGIRAIGFAAFLTAAVGAGAQVGETRDWKSADGRTLTGRLVSVTPEKIVVDRGGRRLDVPVKLLSVEDQKFVTELLERKAAAGDEEARLNGFKEGKYADAVEGEWIKFDKSEHGLIYQLYIGREATRKKAGPLVPLFVQLHGASGRRDDIDAGKVEIAAKNLVEKDQYSKTPCVVCAPLCPPEPESWGKQTSKLEAIIDDLVANLPIDRTRIYISGYSMGAGGVGSLLSSRPDFYGAALFADGSPKDSWHGRVKTPMWFYFSGERDSSNMEAVKAKFAEDGVEVKYDIFEDAKHNDIHWRMAKAPETYAWLFEQRRATE